jgi:hypothetical protein
MHYYCESMTQYRRLLTREVRVGDLLLGNGHPIRVQTMTTTDTLDTAAGSRYSFYPECSGDCGAHCRKSASESR